MNNTTYGTWTNRDFCVDCEEDITDEKHFNKGICPYCGQRKNTIVAEHETRVARRVFNKITRFWIFKTKEFVSWDFKDKRDKIKEKLDKI